MENKVEMIKEIYVAWLHIISLYPSTDVTEVSLQVHLKMTKIRWKSPEN